MAHVVHAFEIWTEVEKNVWGCLIVLLHSHPRVSGENVYNTEANPWKFQIMLDLKGLLVSDG